MAFIFSSGGQGGEVQPLVRLITERNSQVEVLSSLTNFKHCVASVTQCFFAVRARRQIQVILRCHCAAAPPPCCISMEIYYASNADRKKWNLPNWLFCSGKYVRAKCKCKTSHPKKRNLSNWLECTGQLLRSKFEQSKNCHPKKWNLSHRL